MVRRIFNRLQTGENAVVTINNDTGRVMLDIGSAFNNKDAVLVSEVQTYLTPECGADEHPENEEIFRNLEISSFDEYDDFNPRHPQMKNRAHRRGDSYFSSDIDMLANEPKLTAEIQSINSIIQADAAEPVINLKNKFLKTGKIINPGSGLGIAGKPPLPSTPKKVVPKTAKAALEDSDDDN